MVPRGQGDKEAREQGDKGTRDARNMELYSSHLKTTVAILPVSLTLSLSPSRTVVSYVPGPSLERPRTWHSWSRLMSCQQRGLVSRMNSVARMPPSRSRSYQDATISDEQCRDEQCLPGCLHLGMNSVARMPPSRMNSVGMTVLPGCHHLG